MNMYFVWLLVAHGIGDFGFQTSYQAEHKAEGRFWNRALMAHAATYTVAFLPVFILYGVSLFWLAPIFLSHMVIDRRWPIKWVRKLKGESKEAIKNTFWLTIVLDQFAHFLILAIIATIIL